MTRFRLDLEHDPRSAGVARRDAGERVRTAWPRLEGLDELVDDVRIVASELVGNAIRHGRAPLVLDVDLVVVDGRHRVVLTCHDGGPWDGTDPHPSGGRGLVVVRALCTALAIDADEHHTTVVATLER